jgi:hypothetical protein
MKVPNFMFCGLLACGAVIGCATRTVFSAPYAGCALNDNSIRSAKRGKLVEPTGLEEKRRVVEERRAALALLDHRSM